MKVSESFFSCQLEGPTTGIAAYFIRLTNCSLSCGFSPKAIITLKKELDEKNRISNMGELGTFADLKNDGSATWFCDSTGVWLKGIDITNEEMEQRIIDASTPETPSLLARILSGEVHFIWTGGEPSLPMHQKAIIGFLDYLHNKYPGACIYSEIETNGTVVTTEEFYKQKYTGHIQQINCSPKLENSGMPENRRIVPNAIKQIMQHPNYWFKFVISKEEDIVEIQDQWIKRFSIPKDRIIIMPGVEKQEHIFERSKFVIEMTKKYGYRSITRGQVVAFGEVVGV